MSAQRAREAKELITDLGPAFVKIVQDVEMPSLKETGEVTKRMIRMSILDIDPR